MHLKIETVMPFIKEEVIQNITFTPLSDSSVQEIVELLGFVRENKVIFGTKVTEKSFKNGVATKVFASSSCDDLTLRKIKHYGKISNVEIVELDLDSDELSQKLGKPFLI